MQGSLSLREHHQHPHENPERGGQGCPSQGAIQGEQAGAGANGVLPASPLAKRVIGQM